jgi:crossover junction endonuclease MUS81
MIILDIRETKLIELFNSINNILYKKEALPIGDIIIQHIHNKVTYEIILERKCVTDMVASIKDGRYKEQKLRLLAERNNSNIIRKVKIAYLVEGTSSECRNSQDKIMLLGSVISSIFRDDIPILRTISLQETSELIIRLYERLIKDFTNFFPLNIHTVSTMPTINLSLDTNNPVNVSFGSTEVKDNTNEYNITPTYTYLASIKKNKKDNMTPQIWNQNCLCGIPGVSNTIAIKISERFPTVKSLLDTYNNCPNQLEKELMLADIMLTETDKQRRRIGAVISKRVFDYFHC